MNSDGVTRPQWLTGNDVVNDNGDGSQISHLHMQCFLLDTEAKRRLTLNTLSVGRREESLRLAPLREPRPRTATCSLCPLVARPGDDLSHAGLQVLCTPRGTGGQTLRSFCKRRSPGIETPSLIDGWSAHDGPALGTQQQVRTMRPFPDLREGSLVQARTVLQGRSWHSRQVCPTSEPSFSPGSHLAKAPEGSSHLEGLPGRSCSRSRLPAVGTPARRPAARAPEVRPALREAHQPPLCHQRC